LFDLETGSPASMSRAELQWRSALQHRIVNRKEVIMMRIFLAAAVLLAAIVAVQAKTTTSSRLESSAGSSAQPSREYVVTPNGLAIRDGRGKTVKPAESAILDICAGC
jgi:hypothetical protein